MLLVYVAITVIASEVWVWLEKVEHIGVDDLQSWSYWWLIDYGFRQIHIAGTMDLLCWYVALCCMLTQCGFWAVKCLRWMSNATHHSTFHVGLSASCCQESQIFYCHVI